MKTKKSILIFLLQLIAIVVLTFAESYWATKAYNDQPSSACLDCSLKSDLYSFSILTTIIIGLFLLITNWLKIRQSLQLRVNVLLSKEKALSKTLFLLNDTGCEEITLKAEILQAGKIISKMVKKISFACGE